MSNHRLKYYRRLPRINTNMPAQCYKGDSIPMAVKNFTPDGFFLATDAKFSIGERFCISIHSPDFNQSIQSTVKTVWRKQDESEPGVGVKIIDMPTEDRALLKSRYLALIQTEFLPYAQTLIEPNKIHSVFPFKNSEISFEFINKIYQTHKHCVLIADDFSWKVHGAFQSINPHSAFILLSDPAMMKLISVGQKINVYFESENNRLFFWSLIQGVVKNTLIVSMPEEIFTLLESDKRRRYYRAEQEPSWNMSVEIPLPYPTGAALRKEIIDISANGLAFKVYPNESYFLPGTPLSDIAIYKGAEKIMNTQAEIRHITPIIDEKDGEALKVGVQFKIRSKRFLKGYLHSDSVVEPIVQNGSNGWYGNYKTVRQPIFTIPIPKLAKPFEWKTEKIAYRNQRKETISAILDFYGAPGSPAPIIVISPAYGKKKESTALLASMILQNFILYDNPVAVIRYDGVRSVGQSFKDIECRQPGHENLNMSLSQMIEDMQTAIDFCYSNPYLTPDKVILCSPSLSAVAGRKILISDQAERVHFWICPMGVVDPRSAFMNLTGGIDYCGILEQGKNPGVAAVLGYNVDWRRFWLDALQRECIGIDQACAEIEKIPIPIAWIHGAYDAWVSESEIKSLLQRYQGANAAFYSIPTGHLPLNGKEAIEMFASIIYELRMFLYNKPSAVYEPTEETLNNALSAEWRCSSHAVALHHQNLPISIFKDLLSRTGNRAFFESNAFNRLIAHECSLLKPAPGQTIAAIGSTADAVVRSMKKLYQLNNAQIFLLDNEEPTNAVLFLSDPVAAPIVRFVKVNLDFNPLIAVRQFCENEFDNFELFKGLISGLTDYTIQLWKDNLSDTLIQLLKGKQIEPKDISFINDNFPQCEADIIFDMNQAARHVLLYANSTEQQPKELNTKILKFQPYFHDTAMPFESNTFDYIHCSLILSYLNSPSMALQEMRRLLKPNGSLVISVFSAQAKISTVNNAFLDKLLELYPECLLTDNGQDSDRLIFKIQELSQTMEFLPYFYGAEPLHFFTVDGLKSLLTSPRYNDVEIIEKPDGFPYALIAKCTK